MKQPYVYPSIEEVGLHSFPFPNIGDTVPKGWREYGGKGGLFFVDSSGFGHPDEAALTADQFIAKIQEILAINDMCEWTIGWAIVEVGQFQVYVQAFKKEE
jgi:hypothetical protein